MCVGTPNKQGMKRPQSCLKRLAVVHGFGRGGGGVCVCVCVCVCVRVCGCVWVMNYPAALKGIINRVIVGGGAAALSALTAGDGLP